MIHHDARPYAVAVSEAARKFQEKLENMIHGSVKRVQRVIEQVQNDVPEDAIVQGRALRFAVAPDTKQLVAVRDGNGTGKPQAIYPSRPVLTIHDHAFDQICTRLNVRHLVTVMKDIRSRGEWGEELVAKNLNNLYSHLNGERFLLRQVRGELRGFLSDQYRRLDSRPLLDAFVMAIQRFGARPVDGFALGTKVLMRAILPYVFEPFPGEIMAFGAQLSDSDYGDGKLMLSGIVERMWCTNLATTQDVLSQVHLGRKIADNVIFSQRTLELDTQAMSSAINDCAGHVLTPAAINNYLDMVRKANEEKVEATAINAWVKKNLTKAEGEAVEQKFASAEVEMLPPGQTKWRFSNALSWLANETEDERRKLELQEFAGGVLKPAA